MCRYDAKIRPDYDGPPTEVEVNLAIRSMGPVDESKQIFTLDCYFRQYWTDPRLMFTSDRQDPATLTMAATRVTEITLNWNFLSRIWKPDTFFVNGKDSYLHKIAVPNRSPLSSYNGCRFIRVASSGRVSYSQRLTVTARCRMDLSKFPHDSQVGGAVCTRCRCAPSRSAASATTPARWP